MCQAANKLFKIKTVQQKSKVNNQYKQYMKLRTQMHLLKRYEHI